MKRRLVGALNRVGLLDLAVGAKRWARQTSSKGRQRRRGRRFDHIRDAADADDRVIFIDDWPVVAQRRTELDPIDERQNNLDVVLLACARDGASHFVSRSSTPGRTRVGLAEPVGSVLAQLDRGTTRRSVAIERSGSIVRIAEPGSAAKLAGELRASDVVTVFGPVFHTDGGHVVRGTEYACELEPWRPTAAGRLTTDVPNLTANSMPAPKQTGLVVVPEFDWLGDPWRPPFEIDAVYTWVDGADPAWRERQRRYQPTDAASDGAGAERYQSFDELRYSLRSLRQHAPFFRRIFLVTDQQRPDWLLDDLGVTVVDHADIFRPTEALPVFNSHAIESQLHHIPGLAEHYVYINDDVFFGRNVSWTDFYTLGGLARFAESNAKIPIGPASEDPAVDHSGANARALLHHLVGVGPSRKIKHTPHPQLRSVHEELERMIPEVYEQVGATRFRSEQDISLAALFHHRYGEATGRAMPSRFDYDYVNLSRPDLRHVLDRLASARRMTFCLNDASLPREQRDVVAAVLTETLSRMYPFPAPWEAGHARPGDNQ